MVVGALFLTKDTAVALAPGLVLAAYLSATRRADGGRLAGVAAGVALLVGSPWLIHNAVSYGDPLALHKSHSYLTTINPFSVVHDPALKVLFVEMPKEFYKGFWYQSGALLWFQWRWWAYVPFWLLTAAGLAGLVVPTRRRNASSPPAAAWPRRTILALVVLAVVPVATVWALRVDTTTAQARLAFIGLPALACLVALGLERRRVPIALRFALPVLGVIGSLYAIKHDVVDVAAKVAHRSQTHAVVHNARHRHL